MSETNLPRVGDRVTVDGQDGVFFVLSVNDAAPSLSLLSSENGKVLDNIGMGSLTSLPRPGPNGTTQVSKLSLAL